MKFGMVSECGEGAGILHRLMQEGNDVALYIKDKLYKDSWRGILPKIDNWRKLVSSSDFVLFDTTGFSSIYELCRKLNVPTFGGSSFADRLENDRSFGIEFMHKWGIKTPETKSFTSIDDSIEYVKSKDRLVFKPDDMPTYYTYVAEDQEDMLEYLNFVKEHVNGISKFDLQEFIDGIAISSEVLSVEGKPVEFYDHTIENKKFMNDDIGPSTGCEGNVVWIEDSPTEIIRKGIGKVKDFEDFTGLIDLNCIFNGNDVYGLEWTPRFGYDATPTLLMNLLKSDLSKFFIEGSGDFSDKLATSIRFSIPPYPLESIAPEYDNSGIPIRVNNYKDSNYYFYEIMLEDNILVHSGGMGNIGLGFGISNDIQEAFDISLENVKAVIMPDKQYRTDLNSKITDKFIEVMEVTQNV